MKLRILGVCSLLALCGDLFASLEWTIMPPEKPGKPTEYAKMLANVSYDDITKAAFTNDPLKNGLVVVPLSKGENGVDTRDPEAYIVNGAKIKWNDKDIATWKETDSTTLDGYKIGKSKFMEYKNRRIDEQCKDLLKISDYKSSQKLYRVAYQVANLFMYKLSSDIRKSFLKDNISLNDNSLDKIAYVDLLDFKNIDISEAFDEDIGTWTIVVEDLDDEITIDNIKVSYIQSKIGVKAQIKTDKGYSVLIGDAYDENNVKSHLADKNIEVTDEVIKDVARKDVAVKLIKEYMDSEHPEKEKRVKKQIFDITDVDEGMLQEINSQRDKLDDVKYLYSKKNKQIKVKYQKQPIVTINNVELFNSTNQIVIKAGGQNFYEEGEWSSKKQQKSILQKVFLAVLASQSWKSANSITSIDDASDTKSELSGISIDDASENGLLSSYHDIVNSGSTNQIGQQPKESYSKRLWQMSKREPISDNVSH